MSGTLRYGILALATRATLHYRAMAAKKNHRTPPGRNHAKARAGKLKICGVAKGNGEPCLQPAGNGTAKSTGPCQYHGGKKKGGVVSTARRLGMTEAVTPNQAILGCLQLAAGNLAWVNAKVLALDEDDIGDDSSQYWIRWQERLMDKVSKYAGTAVAMGVEQRRIELAEEQTALMTRVIEGVLGELNLPAAKRKQVGPAIRKQLAAIEAAKVPNADG